MLGRVKLDMYTRGRTEVHDHIQFSNDLHVAIIITKYGQQDELL